MDTMYPLMKLAPLKNLPASQQLDTSQEPYRLGDYYVKTAYNCCCGGNYKNDFVDYMCFKSCITRRC